MSWSKGILMAFVFFAVFIISLVIVCVRQDISLVSKDYYQEEIAYQEQIERMRNAMALQQKPVISVANNFVKIDSVDFHQLEKGKLNLFCPSDAGFDKSFDLNSASSQKFDLGKMKKGFYKARLLWSVNGKEFFIEQSITI
jgi:hypothetical protein